MKQRITFTYQYPDNIMESYQNLFNAVSEGIILHDSGVIVDANHSSLTLLGHDQRRKSEVIGMSVLHMLAKESHETAIAILDYTRENPNLMIGPVELVVKKNDGSYVDVEIFTKPYIHRGRSVRLVSARDITERKRTEAALRKSEERYRELFDNANDMVITIDLKGNITSVNKMAEEITGHSVEDAIGKNVSCLLRPDHLKKARKMIESKIRGETRTVYDLDIISKDGRVTPSEISSNLMFQSGQPVGVQAFVRDITERNKMLDKLRKMSFKDGLTRLANRRYFDEVLNNEWKRAKRESHSISLALIDVDSFKSYNDTYGHQEGDVCLKSISRVIKPYAKRPGDLAARYGGEEFALILPCANTQNAFKIAEKIRKRVQTLKITHNGSKVDGCKTISISAGVATLVPDTGSSQSILVNLADKALYSAKNQGRNQVVLSK
jgi:diguanylate cyclase (GGDEF)-like protein/PAS domain S-box-containing protein